MNAEQLEQQVREALVKFNEQAIANSLNGDPDWTLKIATCMANLGREHGYKVCVSGLIGDDREWLYDMVWYTEVGEKREDVRLRSVPFIMECEWSLSTERIAEDFEKLLLANSYLRLMVCKMSQESRVSMASYFEDSLKGFEQGRDGDRVLIAILDPKTYCFEFETYVR